GQAVTDSIDAGCGLRRCRIKGPESVVAADPHFSCGHERKGVHVFICECGKRSTTEHIAGFKAAAHCCPHAAMGVGLNGLDGLSTASQSEVGGIARRRVEEPLSSR